uniref:beta-mannosidase n=1 Tax=Parastrongyloides trichosuri TaxID=131310 RepID=A0A0N4ZUF7_PARTI
MIFKIFFYTILCVECILSIYILDLSSTSTEWEFSSANESYKGIAKVPGHIFADLERLLLIPGTLYSNNYISNRWISYTSWRYNTTFFVDKHLLKSSHQMLNIPEIDTLAHVYMNNFLLGKFNNQHRHYIINLLKDNSRSLLVEGKNNLTVLFFSNPLNAKNKFEQYKKKHGLILYPSSQPNIIHGIDHVNFIRKNQASFGWDWGPAIDSVGIKKNLWIEFGEENDDIVLGKLRVVINFNDNFFTVNVKTNIWGNKIKDASIIFEFPELGLKNHVSISDPNQKIVETTFKINLKNINLWWPINYGKQYMYTLYASTNNKRQQKIKIAFRSVKLIQNYIDDKNKEKGRHFYFMINNIPIFLKGTNYIPNNITDNNDDAINWKRKEYLLRSVVKVNMNTIRIWGGGVYETDKFYNLADELGILIWHDLMFACALYPINKSFITNVNNEIMEQIIRLSHHPSIIIWAGNNENEVAINSWWNTNSKHKEEYKFFYKTVILNIVKKYDSSRPFILSSPSNGIESLNDGGISKNPMSEIYGDIHYYNDFSNLWNTSTFLIPRCSTEYGVQSYPDPVTMKQYLGKEYKPFSDYLLSRQHHMAGEEALQGMIAGHFKLFTNYTKSNYLQRFTYLTQIHQAISIERQSLHYRSWRSKIDKKGRGFTNCAMFWQLNDVWAAPSWSSIDFNLRWKPLMYHVRRFFNDISIFLDIKDNNLRVNIINDKNYDLVNISIIINTYAWTAGIDPIYIENKSLPLISKLSSFDLEYNFNIGYSEEYLITSFLVSSDGNQISPTSYLYPDKFFNVPAIKNTLKIEELKEIDINNYEIKITCENIIPLIWIDLTEDLLSKYPDIIYEFSDNSFSMVNKEVILKLVVINNPKNIRISINNVKICFLDNCGNY